MADDKRHLVDKSDGGIFAATSKQVSPNTTASLGFDKIRPAAEISYKKVTDSTGPNVSTTDTVTLTGTTVVGKPATVSGYVSSATTRDMGNNNSIVYEKGVGGKFSYGSTPEVTAAVRVGYNRDNGEGLSPYFSASATGGGGQPPSARLEAGVCIKPDLGSLSTQNTCVGVSHDTQGKTRANVSIGHTF